jgi:uncharacterized phage protein (TIGR02218 family)
MKSVSVALAAHLAGGTTSMVTCWLVTRTDAQAFGFTSCDFDLLIDGVTYSANTGIDRTAIKSTAGLQVDNLEVKGFLDSAQMTESDLRAGMWDHATVRIFEVNRNDLTMGAMKQSRGWMGEVATTDDFTFNAELRSMFAALNATVGEPYSPGCAARVGDARCGKDMTDYTVPATVFVVTDNREFTTDLASTTVRLTPTTTGAPPTGYFDGGLLTWLTGANTGRGVEVKYYAAGSLELQLPMFDNVVAGDTFSIESGCLKDRLTCFTKFGNVARFRGHPDLPGTDKVLRVGGQ